MTDDLRTLLHDRAASVSFDPVDLNTIELNGARAVRRRRVQVIAGVVTVVTALLVASVVAVGIGRGSGRAPEVAGSSVPAGLSWAQGSVIHDGDADVDVGRTVERYVRTTLGYVFTDTDGTVWSWQDGTATRVGHTTGPLFAATAGPLVGWVDDAVQRRPALHFFVLDQATGRGQAHQALSGPAGAVAPGEYLGARFVGLDNQSAWWLDAHDYYRENLTWPSGLGDQSDLNLPRPQGLDLPPRQQILAASTTILVEQDLDTGHVAVVRGEQKVDLAEAPGGTALLSPDSAHVAFGTDQGGATAQVYNTDTGDQVRLEPAAWSALITQWLDNETVALLVASSENDNYRLETCSVRTVHCTIAVPDLGSGPRTEQGNGLRFRLPTGDYWFPYPHG